MKKIWLTTAGIMLAGAASLTAVPAQAFWGSWGSGGPWYGGPWHRGPWYGGYPYYGGWGHPYYGGWGHPYYGGWGSPWYGGYPYAVAPLTVAPAAPAASSSTSK